VIGAAVPEAGVHEHGDSRAGEHNVSLSAELGDGPAVHEEPETEPVELTSKSELGLGVPPRSGLHPFTDGGAARARSLRRKVLSHARIVAQPVCVCLRGYAPSAVSSGPPPALENYFEQLSLGTLEGVPAEGSDLVEQFTAMVDEAFQSRRFVLGLAMAFLSMAENTLTLAGVDSVDDVLDEFEYERATNKGRPVNTLNLIVAEGSVVRLRPLYNKVEHVFRSTLRRYDYPHMPGHATQAWRQHEDMLRAVFAMSAAERRAAAEAVWDRILAFPEFRRRSTADALPRPFETLLAEFPNTQRGEPAGAILQGLAFAYYRADSPNVTIETGKVGAGSRRTGRVADVDGWSGDELVLSIEVKDEDLTDPDDDTLDSFIANLSEWPDATAIVVARSASDEVIDALAAQNVKMLTRTLMLDAVVRWDMNKQMLAAREFLYYLSRQQQHSGLVERLRDFLADRVIPI
jgi:hypothetical protein